MNKILSNLHTHTHFSDGAGAPEDFILAAMEKSFRSIGFSEHAYSSYDIHSRMKKENIPAYREEIRRLKEKYAGSIEVCYGIENDYFEPMPAEEYDFVIGSTHFVCGEDGEYIGIDITPDQWRRAADAMGGVNCLLERYYEQVVDIARSQRPDILGHLDLIAKFNGSGYLFQSSSAFYRRMEKTVAEAIAQTGCIVEVNSGGMFRGYTAQPYPSKEILAHLHRLEVPVTISSDAHCVEGLDYYFGEMAALLREVGFRSIRQLIGGCFTDIPL